MRGEQSKCVYASKQSEDHQHGLKRRRPFPRDEELQQRLDNLERLILDAANGPSPSIQSPSINGVAADRSPSSKSSNLTSDVRSSTQVGYLDKSGPNTVYAGDTAFHGILQEVRMTFVRLLIILTRFELGHLRNLYLESTEQSFPPENEIDQAREPDFDPLRRTFLATSSQGPQLSKQALVDHLPSRAESDGLLARFFTNDDPAIPVNCKTIHFHQSLAY